MTQQDKIATEIDEDADYTCDDLYDTDRMEAVDADYTCDDLYDDDRMEAVDAEDAQ